MMMKLIDLKKAFYLFVYCIFEWVNEILLLAYRELNEIEEERNNRRGYCYFEANIWCLWEQEVLNSSSLAFLPCVLLYMCVRFNMCALLLNIMPTF